MSNKNHIVLIGNGSTWSLEKSYERAFRQLGFETTLIDIPTRLQAELPFGKIMRKLRVILDETKWIKAVNREIAVEILDLNPRAILVFCTTEIVYGTLALLQTASNIKTILIWPDTPFNFTPEIRLAASVYDLACTYSCATVDVFKRMGYHRVIWLPLAADPDLHGNKKESESFSYDISFIGGWRPEREAVLSAALRKFNGNRIQISGSNWKRNIRNKRLLAFIDETALTGSDYADFINASNISLNIIDRTNFPAANMRFFEIPMSYGFQLSSECPEQEDIFKEGEHLCYFSNLKDIVEKIDYCLSHTQEVKEMRKNALELVMTQHTYTHRAERLLEELRSIES